MVGFHAATRLACDALHNSAIDAWAPHTQTGTNARCAAMMIRPYKLPRDSARSALLTAVSLISIWAERVGFHATGSLCPFARRLRPSLSSLPRPALVAQANRRHSRTRLYAPSGALGKGATSPVLAYPWTSFIRGQRLGDRQILAR
jgi:hypothetical protein